MHYTHSYIDTHIVLYLFVQHEITFSHRDPYTCIIIHVIMWIKELRKEKKGEEWGIVGKKGERVVKKGERVGDRGRVVKKGERVEDSGE